MTAQTTIIAQTIGRALPTGERAAGVSGSAKVARWRGLFITGGAAALIAGLLFRRNLDAELTLLRATGILRVKATPTTVADWFTLLHEQRLVGLTLLNVFDMVNYALVGLMFLALCVVFSRTRPSAMMMAGALTLTAVVVYLSSNQAFALLALSERYFTAGADAQRAALLAAGEAALAIHQSAMYGGAGIYPSFGLISVAGLILAAAMRRSKVFGKATAYTGILANVCGLAYYVALIAAPALVALPISVSALFLLAWYVLIGRRLFQLARTGLSSEG